MTNIRLLFSNQKYCEFITFTFYLFLFLVFIFVRLVLLLYQSYLIQNVQVAPYLCVLVMVRTRRSILIFYCSHSINCTFHMHFLPLTCDSHIPNITTFQYKNFLVTNSYFSVIFQLASIFELSDKIINY